MKVDIKIISSQTKTMNNIPCIWGQITLGDFTEEILIPLDYWTVQDYQKQWLEAIERLKTNTKSCLVASIQDPKKAPYLNWWPMYKRGKKIYIQNHMLHGKDYLKKFGSEALTPKNCYKFIPYRKTKTSSGLQVSEWEISL